MTTEKPACAKCQHWDPPAEWPHDEKLKAAGVVARRCSKAVMWWDATDWAEVDGEELPIRFLKPEYSANKMFTMDQSDYRADLYTTADFYCAHFELKRPQP